MATADPELEREVGLFEATVYGVGLILGAGIYAIVGEAAGVAGDSLVVSFVLAAAIASFTGLSYAELASRYPVAESDFVYVWRAFESKSSLETIQSRIGIRRLVLRVAHVDRGNLFVSGWVEREPRLY